MPPADGSKKQQEGGAMSGGVKQEAGVEKTGSEVKEKKAKAKEKEKEKEKKQKSKKRRSSEADANNALASHSSTATSDKEKEKDKDKDKEKKESRKRKRKEKAAAAAIEAAHDSILAALAPPPLPSPPPPPPPTVKAEEPELVKVEAVEQRMEEESAGEKEVEKEKRAIAIAEEVAAAFKRQKGSKKGDTKDKDKPSSTKESRAAAREKVKRSREERAAERDDRRAKSDKDKGTAWIADPALPPLKRPTPTVDPATIAHAQALADHTLRQQLLTTFRTNAATLINQRRLRAEERSRPSLERASTIIRSQPPHLARRSRLSVASEAGLAGRGGGGGGAADWGGAGKGEVAGNKRKQVFFRIKRVEGDEEWHSRVRMLLVARRARERRDEREKRYKQWRSEWDEEEEQEAAEQDGIASEAEAASVVEERKDDSSTENAMDVSVVKQESSEDESTASVKDEANDGLKLELDVSMDTSTDATATKPSPSPRAADASASPAPEAASPVPPPPLTVLEKAEAELHRCEASVGELNGRLLSYQSEKHQLFEALKHVLNDEKLSSKKATDEEEKKTEEKDREDREDREEREDREDREEKEEREEREDREDEDELEESQQQQQQQQQHTNTMTGGAGGKYRMMTEGSGGPQRGANSSMLLSSPRRAGGSSMMPLSPAKRSPIPPNLMDGRMRPSPSSSIFSPRGVHTAAGGGGPISSGMAPHHLPGPPPPSSFASPTRRSAWMSLIRRLDSARTWLHDLTMRTALSNSATCRRPMLRRTIILRLPLLEVGLWHTRRHPLRRCQQLRRLRRRPLAGRVGRLIRPTCCRPRLRGPGNRIRLRRHRIHTILTRTPPTAARPVTSSAPTTLRTSRPTRPSTTSLAGRVAALVAGAVAARRMVRVVRWDLQAAREQLVRVLTTPCRRRRRGLSALPHPARLHRPCLPAPARLHFTGSARATRRSTTSRPPARTISHRRRCPRLRRLSSRCRHRHLRLCSRVVGCTRRIRMRGIRARRVVVVVVVEEG